MPTTSFRLALLFVLAGLLPLVFPPATAADPVTFTYRIDVNERCDHARCRPFDRTFLLSLSFDPTPTDTFNEFGHVRQYGPPTFSAVPLERPPVLPGAERIKTTEQRATDQGFRPWGHTAFAIDQSEVVTDEFYYRWHLNLVNFQDSLPRPRFDPVSFAAFLAEGEFRYAFVQENRRTFALAPGSVSYRGAASLVDGPNPVPEPMSLLLVGSGACGIGFRAWRRRARKDPATVRRVE